MEEPGLPSARFDTLPTEEIVALLRTHHIGRVAWESAHGPVILPVAYAWRAGEMAFRTATDSPLGDLVTPREVAFQIDDYDIETATGWSVLVSATTAQVIADDDLAAWQELLPEPWAPGNRDCVIRLTPRTLSGRAVSRR
ncbi:MAG: pyridoxamine 5'-phosphate oxidase family protein [Propionibacteriaceae bacterium]|nr:pyridoxamine 5'-phosphate oxidase family protein [Propionibacteriaceae bacterium]